MTQRHFTLGMAFLAALAIVGCSKEIDPVTGDQPPVGVSNEEQAITYYASNDEFVLNDADTFTDRELTGVDGGTFGKIDAAVTPLHVARIVTGVTADVNVAFEPGDTIATAHVVKEITGVLRVRAINAAGDTVLLEKPFVDKAERNMLFKRFARNPRMYWTNWKPVATSLVQGGTVAPNNAIRITKLEVFGPSDTLTITDPQSFYLRYPWIAMMQHQKHLGKGDVPQFTGGQEVRLVVTLESTSQDTDFVALRYGFLGLNWRRVPMALTSEVNNGGVYTRVFETTRMKPIFIHFYRGFFHLGIDALTRGSIFDDQAPYSASWWGVPYRVM